MLEICHRRLFVACILCTCTFLLSRVGIILARAKRMVILFFLKRLIMTSQFSLKAEEATNREGSDWDYSAERSHLQSIMNDTRKKQMDRMLR